MNFTAICSAKVKALEYLQKVAAQFFGESCGWETAIAYQKVVDRFRYSISNSATALMQIKLR